MRKILAICLVAILILSASALSVSAIQPGGSSGANVYIKYDETEMSRYSIDIVFGDMTFVYDVYSVWDTEKHEYVITENGESTWLPEKEGGDKIKIYNHSDLPIAYETTFENVSSAYGALVLTAIDGQGSLARCPLKATYEEVPSGVVTISLSGTPVGLSEEKVTLARVVVTIHAVK